MTSSAKAPHNGALAIWLVLLLGLVSMVWWALAFLPMSPETPDWLQRAQYACFGTMPNGLPDTYGWMLLFFGPASFLVIMFFVYPSELMAGWSLLKKSRGVQALFFVMGCAAAYETGWVAQRIMAAAEVGQVSFEPTAGGRLPPEYPQTALDVPAFELVNQKGERMGSSELKGKVVLMTYAFAHCQTVCPVLIRQTLSAAAKLSPDKVISVFITLDPWRDNPSSLPALAQKWKLPENAYLLSGEIEKVNRTLGDLRVPRERNLKTGEVVHPALVHVLDTNGKIAYSFNNPPVDWLVDAANKILK